jgi:alkanesulfonate monooxygenase SsuD/methylene tetrahydromethanopterin reductase-like flavin-dependent oxidoreductase (luciferase family)
MKIGLGLPPITDRAVLLEWARRAEAGPFSTLGLLDRLVYDNPEPLVTLAMLAGATERIRLQTEVLLAPLRETPLLAKQAATLDRLSGGRFTLGLGVGGRDDDHEVAGVDIKTRGRRLDAQMDKLRELWQGDVVGPAPLSAGGPEVLFGAFAPAALARVAKYGDGLLAAGPPQGWPASIDSVRTSWQQAGRAGEPRIVVQVNAAIGEPAATEARTNAMAYYGMPYGQRVADTMLDKPEQVHTIIEDAEKLGADELMLYVWATDPAQVTTIAAVIEP